MNSDPIELFPLAKCFLSNYTEKKHTKLPNAGKIDYSTILSSTHSYLMENVHPTIGHRSALTEGAFYLTDHGPQHITTVLRRATILVTSKRAKPSRVASSYCLEPYEIFLLIMAIHFHDVGNMYGRADHEKRIREVMARVPPLQSLPWFEQTEIARIALCHGGTVSHDKDTIGRILTPEQKHGDVLYRPQLLAAVLRLADELADESSRADSFGLLEPTKLPIECLIFHKYAAALHSVEITDGAIALTFHLHAADATQTFRKRRAEEAIQSVYLLDEIYERTLKTYAEMVYCQRFMRSLDFHLHVVRVSIMVFRDTEAFHPCKSINYTLGDAGYPYHLTPTQNMAALARGFDPSITGESLAQQLRSA